MRKPDLIIAAITQHSWDQLEPYVVSLNRTGFSGKKVMFVRELEPEVAAQLRNYGWQLEAMTAPPTADFCVDRLLPVARWVENHCEEFRFVIWTDVRDVIYQTNPTEWLSEYEHEGSIFAATECILIKDEPTNDMWCRESFSYDEWQALREHEVLNGGTLAARACVFHHLFQAVYNRAKNAPIIPADQASFNLLLRTRFEMRVPRLWAAFALVGSWILQWDKFGPLLTEQPVLLDELSGLVLAPGSGRPFCIVHQYDRHGRLAEIIRAKYKEPSSVASIGEPVA